MLRALIPRFCVRTNALGLDFGSPGRSRARFWRPKRLDLRGFSTLARGRRIHCPRLTKHCVGARILSFELLRDTTKTTQNRSASVLDSARCTKCARGPLRSCLGASQNPPGETFGWVPGALGPPQTPQDRSRTVFFGVPDPSRACPGAFPKRLRAPKTAHDRFCIDFLWILAPFSWIFERFFVEFRSSRL